MTTAAERERVKATAYQVTERRRIVRRLVVEGVPEGEIVAMFVNGVDTKNPHLGVKGVVQVSESTARRDLALVLEEFAGLFTSEDAATLEIGAARERIRQIAVRAASGPRPQYHAALAANVRLIDLAARGCPAYHHLASTRVASGGLPPDELDEDERKLAAEVAELRSLPQDELERRHHQLEARSRALGLKVHPGGDLAARKG